MFFNKFILSFFTVLYIQSVLAVSTIFNKGDRPEIFELTDNEVAVFKVTLPEEDFTKLKKKAKIEGLVPPRENLSDTFVVIEDYLRKNLELINEENFYEEYPLIDVAGKFPELNIQEDGYAHLDVDEIMKGYDLDFKHYANFNFIRENILIYIMSNNSILNVTDISERLFEEMYAMNSITSVVSQVSKFNESNYDTEIKSMTSLLSNITNIDNNTEKYNSYHYSSTYDAVFEEPTEYYNNHEVPSGYYGYYELPSGYDEDELLKYIEEMFGNNNHDFKTKNGQLTVEIAGKEKSFDKITFSLSGQYSRYLQKPNFNLKIRGGKDLFGRSQFKLRSDYTEPTFLRSKLTSDMHKLLGLPSILANYATLYINDEYMGLFVLTDSYKKSWVEFVYGEEDTTNLYKCSAGSYLTVSTARGCENENDDIDDYESVMVEWYNFLSLLDDAQSAEDIENIFEVDYFLYEMAIEYLLGGWDHLQLGHNYYMYKQPNGKWIYLTYDNDHEFGINIDRVFVGYIFNDLPEYYENININYPKYSFEEWTQKYHIIDILILRDPTRFNNILKDVVERVFNPAILYPRIDELKSFIKPYVDLEYTPDADGHYPGRINTLGNNPYTQAYWDANSEFTTVDTLQYNAYGIKYWILEKYRYVCKTYDIKCDSTYFDESYEYSVNKEIEFKGYYSSNSTFEEPVSSPTSIDDVNVNVTTTEINSSETNVIETATTIAEKPSTLTKTITLTTSITSNISIPIETPDTTNTTLDKQYQCWSELIGYPCCDPRITKVYEHDEYYGDFGYDFKKKQWCGLTPYNESTTSDEDCWSEKFGYPCCKGCKVYETDENGSWGYESHKWCGIPSSCQK